jgi:hypothetical protein
MDRPNRPDELDVHAADFFLVPLHLFIWDDDNGIPNVVLRILFVQIQYVANGIMGVSAMSRNPRTTINLPLNFSGLANIKLAMRGLAQTQKARKRRALRRRPPFEASSMAGSLRAMHQEA